MRDAQSEMSTVRCTTVLLMALCPLTLAAQDKPAPPSVPFDQILSCMRAASCKNMTGARIHWFDVVNIDIQAFTDAGWTYSLRYTPGNSRGALERLSVFIARPGETSPTHQLILGSTGQLMVGELGPLPGEAPPPISKTAPPDAWQAAHKVFNATRPDPTGKAVGEEFRSFWQKLADQALDAIRRQISK